MEDGCIRGILGRTLGLGVIGGAPGSFIGGVHRIAARMDDGFQLLCGVVSSNSQRALDAGKDLGFAPDRHYSTVREMLDSEAKRDDGIDVVAIMTPNDSHFEYAMMALDRGFHVICDKPMTNSLEEARKIRDKVRETDLVFCLTHNYTGYPLVRQARAMIEGGGLGDIRLVQVEYVQGGRAKEVVVTPDMPRAWKYDPAKSGPSLVMGDIGSHAHNLLRFVTGLEVTQVCGDAGSIVPHREVHDFAGAMLRMENGARGVFWVTQAAAGIENSLKLRVSGALGSLEWWQELPQRLQFFPIEGPAQVFTPGGPGILPLAARASRIVKGHPEGYLEGFANIYSDAAQAIARWIIAKQSPQTANGGGSELQGGSGPKGDSDFTPKDFPFPNEEDGLRGLEFIDGLLQSVEEGGRWVNVVKS